MPMAVCCLDEQGTWGKALNDEGVQVRALNRTPGFHPLLGRQIERVANAHQANVIHCHQYSPFIYSCLARVWQPSLKILFTEHGRLSDAPPSTKRKVANRVFARLPHRVFAVSANLKQHIVAEGFPAPRVGVVYNGIEIGPPPDAGYRRRVRTSLGIPDETFAIATVARLDPVKDLDVLLRAVASLARRIPAILLIAGDGSERRHLEDLAASLEAQHCIRFLGHRDDVRDVLAGCDAYANSSISEGISLTILEAMAVGLPVVATCVGGTPEILDESCGRLVPARDPEQLAAALLELVSQPAVRARLGRAGRERVERRFTLERMIREYRDEYYEAVA
jgi:glycosyltransferase involved in cell wall biosynthesis